MNIWYITKVWFSVIIVTPVLILVSILLSNGGPVFESVNMEVYLYSVLLGAVLSSPSLIVLLILSLIVDNHINDPIALKICYIGASLVCMFTTVYIFIGEDFSVRDGGGGSLIMYYGLSIFLFGLIYKVKKTVPDVSKEDDAI
jgi:hypothetical protein